MTFWGLSTARIRRGPPGLRRPRPVMNRAFFTMGGICIKTEFLLEKQLQLVLLSLTPENRRVCQVMLHTGLRVGDVVSLRKDQLARQFMVTEQKTGKRRRVGLPDWLRAEILASAGASPWAFPSPRDPAQHRTRQAVWKDIKRAQRAFRLPLNLGSHTMRKVFAVELLDKYGDLKRVQRALAHENASTTALYALADRITASDLRRRSTRAARAREKRAVDKGREAVVN